MKYFLVSVIFLSSCIMNQHKMEQSKPKSLEEVIGNVGDTSSFIKKTLVLKKLKKFELELYSIYNKHSKEDLIKLYENVIKSIGIDSNKLNVEIQENCKSSILDLKLANRDLEIDDFINAWMDLNMFFAGKTKNNEDLIVNIPFKEYSKFYFYKAFFNDENDDVIFGYEIENSEINDTLINLYQLEY